MAANARDRFSTLRDSMAGSRSESWVELSSQPSSSSLSSTNDEIVTTGLRVKRHRKRGRPVGQFIRPDDASSQEEYDESESEESAMQSSAENILNPANLVDEAQEEDDDDQTTLGVQSHRSSFVPQPNIFSRPPEPRSRRHSFNRRHTTGARERDRWSVSHSPMNLVSSNYQPDHDAALRASLSTLLSCAAAVRGSPKHSQNRAVTTDMAPTTFRLMSEADLASDNEETPSNSRPIAPPLNRAQSDSSAEPPVKGKRKASPAPKQRANLSKKSRNVTAVRTADDIFTPTLLTWVVSAGVVVLVSAISFSAGYAMGKEMGYAEAQAFAADATLDSCRSEAVKNGLKDGLKDGLQRFRWATGASAGVA